MTIKHWFLIIKTKFCVYMNLMYYPTKILKYGCLAGCLTILKINRFTSYIDSLTIIRGNYFQNPSNLISQIKVFWEEIT